jgi:hypothetical protein
MIENTLRAAYIRWLARRKWDYFITVNFNTTSSIPAARTNFKRFCQAVDRRLVGPKYYVNNKRRTAIVVAPEHLSANFHFHGLMRLRCRSEPSRRRLDATLNEIWKNIVPSGQIHLQRVYYREGAATYMTKELFVPARLDLLMWSEEFWDLENCKPKKRRRR